MFVKIFLYMIVLGSNCRNFEGPKITIIGKAVEAKAGAVIISDDKGIYYLDGLVYWDKKFYEKKIIKMLFSIQ